jgi:hypothetical protein
MHASVPSSFRDPNTQLFISNGELYRQINDSGLSDYKMLMADGLYKRLTSLGYLIPHEEVPSSAAPDRNVQVVLKPEFVETISYPYEWCFSQLRDAALLTLEVVKEALEFNMILKDASAYNVQFHRGKPIFIDTGSFEKYEDGKPWTAYHQFCKHFLAPLSLMAKKDIRLGLLSRQFIDGIPLDMASRLLPARSWLSFSLLTNIHLHAMAQKKYGNSTENVSGTKKISRVGLSGLIHGLESGIRRLAWHPNKTEWADYYSQTNYSDLAAKHKEDIVRQFVGALNPATIWDLGANNGHFSRIAGCTNANVVCWDIDPLAVEANYAKVKEDKSENILPLIQDLTNPSSGIGWAHQERSALQSRGPVDMIMALALIHHLSISNNLPFQQVADYFSRLGRYLIIEFVPKEDSQVKRLLANRKDVFHQYDSREFEASFACNYEIVDSRKVSESHRTIFLMKNKNW